MTEGQQKILEIQRDLCGIASFEMGDQTIYEFERVFVELMKHHCREEIMDEQWEWDVWPYETKYQAMGVWLEVTSSLEGTEVVAAVRYLKKALTTFQGKDNWSEMIEEYYG